MSQKIGLLSKQELDDCILLQENGIADNGWRAAHIVKGLRLVELKTVKEKMARAYLYRDWRNSGVFGKQTQPCYDKAIAGEAVPVAEMFDGALHSVERAAEHHNVMAVIENEN